MSTFSAELSWLQSEAGSSEPNSEVESARQAPDARTTTEDVEMEAEIDIDQLAAEIEGEVKVAKKKKKAKKGKHDNRRYWLARIL